MYLHVLTCRTYPAASFIDMSSSLVAAPVLELGNAEIAHLSTAAVIQQDILGL